MLDTEYSAYDTSEEMNQAEFDPNSFWKNNYSFIQTEISNLVPEKKFHYDSPLRRSIIQKHPQAGLSQNGDPIRELREFAIEHYVENEKRFIQIVFKTVQKALLEYEKALVLFDLDHTLTQTDADEFTIRPVAPEIFKQYLNPLRIDGNVDVGILSTKAAEPTKQYFEPGNGLFPLREYFDLDEIYSCKEECREWLRQTSDGLITWQTLFQKFGHLLDVNTFNTAQNDQNSSFCIDDIQKLSAIDKIKKQHQDEALVVIDDLIYPDFIKEGRGIYASSVKDCNFFIY